MAKINIRVAGSSNEYGVTISYQTKQIEVPDGYRFANNTILSQTEFAQLESVPFQHRGLAIVGRDSIQTQGGMDNAWKDYKGHLQSQGVGEKDQAAAAFNEWNARVSAGIRGVPLPKTPPRHQAETEAAQMKMAGFGGIAGAGISVVGFGVAGLAIRGLATGVGALVGRMGASAAASAATKKSVEYGAGLIFGGMYIGEAIKTGGANVTDPWKGKASDKAGALNTLTGGLYGMTGLPDISLPAALAKGANTASGILAPALFLGLLPWGRLGGGKSGKSGKEGKQGDSLLMLQAFGSRFQRGSEIVRDFMDTVEFKDGQWQPKDPKKRRLFPLPGQKPEQDPNIDTGSESGPVVDYAPDPEVIPDPVWNPDPAMDFAPEPDALNPLPLPELLPIPAPEQGPAPWPFDPAPGNWNPGPNIGAAPRPAEGGEARERWDRNERQRHEDELKQEREDKQWEKDQLAQWQKKEDWNWRNRHWRAPEPNPRPSFPVRPKPVPPRPYPGEAPVVPVPPVVPPVPVVPVPVPPKPAPPIEMPNAPPIEIPNPGIFPGRNPKPLPPLLPKPDPEEMPVPAPEEIPKPAPDPNADTEWEGGPVVDWDPLPAPLPGQAPAPGAVPGVPIPIPVPKPAPGPVVKPELEPAKPKVGKRVGVGVKKGHGDFDDDEESFPGISMRYGNWLPAAPSFHTGQYPLPPYIIKSGRIVYNVD